MAFVPDCVRVFRVQLRYTLVKHVLNLLLDGLHLSTHSKVKVELAFALAMRGELHEHQVKECEETVRTVCHFNDTIGTHLDITTVIVIFLGYVLAIMLKLRHVLTLTRPVLKVWIVVCVLSCSWACLAKSIGEVWRVLLFWSRVHG